MKTSESTLIATIINGGSQGVSSQLLSEAEEMGITSDCFVTNVCQEAWEVINKIDRTGRQLDEMDVMTDLNAKGVTAADFMTAHGGREDTPAYATLRNQGAGAIQAEDAESNESPSAREGGQWRRLL